MAQFHDFMEVIVLAVETAEVLVVVVGALLAMGRYLLGLQGVPVRS